MASSFTEGDLVQVLKRQWPGMNKEGGAARVTKVHGDGTLAVAYIVGGEKDPSVPMKVCILVSSPRHLLSPRNGDLSRLISVGGAVEEVGAQHCCWYKREFRNGTVIHLI